MPEADIAALQRAIAAPARSIENGVGIWPENVETVAAFLAVATQWRVVCVGGGFVPFRMMVLGLDYTAARTGIEAEGIKITPGLWSGLRVMEAEALEALNGIAG